MSGDRAPIGIFGAGWVGLVTGACFADLGHEVVVRDVVPERIEILRSGRLPFHEAGLPELVEKNRERLHFTLDVADVAEHAELMFICVGTPPTHSGDADLSAVWTVLDELPRLERRALLIMKSTVPVGTGEKVRARLDAAGLAHLGYVSNPEFLAEGTAVRDFAHPDRVVIGAFADADGDVVEALYEPLGAPVVRADVNSAEMIKMAANAFLATRISFINEIANVCEVTGADVAKVAEGVGLDHRLGKHFLRAGMGWGGSCLAPEETVQVRRGRSTRLVALGTLFDELAAGAETERVETAALEVLAWRPGSDCPEFLPVEAATRRPHDDGMLEVRTKMGRRVRCTPDHPFVTSAGVKLADELTTDDWLPLALGAPVEGEAARFAVLDALEPAGLRRDDVIVRADRRELSAIGAGAIRRSTGASALRSRDIVRAGALRLPELDALGVDVGPVLAGTVSNGTYVPTEIQADDDFWRIVGLYCAEGHCSRDGRRVRLAWSFHPRDEFDLVEDVLRFWRRLGVHARLRFAPTSSGVVISSRILEAWWTETLGLGRNCYEQRIPDGLWSSPVEHKRAFLAGLWLGDGSWSYVNRGPSIVLEYGTVSRELADGMLRLLAELGIVARLKVGRTAKSTCDTNWLVVSGAAQVEQLLELVPERQRRPILDSLARTKRIAPTGYRREDGAAWVRVTSVAAAPSSGYVYSLEVPDVHTFVTTGGLVVHNCFPKDSLALKQLASNSGYHFQLLSAVIEVNELQKRRVVGKLQKHLGGLRGKTVALLGLAFKPNTDDMREAPSLVLASRLLAEGAEVRAWDPLAKPGELLRAVTVCDSILEAVEGADAAVIVTEWDELKDFPMDGVLEAMRTPVVIDGRNLLDPETVRGRGFAYEGIGRAASPLPDPRPTAARERELQQ